MAIILLLFLFPITEIYLFFYLGGELGWPLVLLWTAVSFFVGRGVIRWQRSLLPPLVSTTASLPDSLSQIAILLGGFLLMVPGFITDFIGLALILPGTRHLLLLFFKKSIERLAKSGRIQTFTGGGSSYGTGALEAEHLVIDAEYKVTDKEPLK